MPEANNHRPRPTGPTQQRVMVTVTLYRNGAGIWLLTNEPGAIAVEAELARGYRIGKGLGGRPCVLGPAGTLGLSADEAVRRCVLEIPMFQK